MKQAPLRRRQLLILIRAGLVVLGVGLMPVLQACAGTVESVSKATGTGLDALLLAPTDFPAANVRQVQQFGQREIGDGGQTAQVILEDDRGRIIQSVVIFPSPGVASASLQSVRQGGAGALWQAVPEAPTFGQESVVFEGKQGYQDALLAIFRQGRILERITWVGTREMSELIPYARKAEERTKQRGLR